MVQFIVWSVMAVIVVVVFIIHHCSVRQVKQVRLSNAAYLLNWFYGTPRSEGFPFGEDPDRVIALVDDLLKKIPQEHTYRLHTILYRCKEQRRFPDVPERTFERLARQHAIDHAIYWLGHGRFSEKMLNEHAQEAFNHGIF